LQSGNLQSVNLQSVNLQFVNPQSANLQSVNLQSAVCNLQLTMLPSTIPVFPLPNVVLFPNVFLPLHIFEPRYRQMVEDALNGDRIVGMVLLRPGWERDYDGRPPVYPIGCAGVITHAERLSDGRFNIVLRGMEKFRVMAEEAGKPYRVAHVESLAEPPAEGLRAEMRGERRRLEALLVPQPEGHPDPKVPSSMADEDLVNALAQYLEFDAVEKQALLERNGVLDRCRSLIELLEMKVLVARHSWDREGSH
jgi:Lon protease-like protein